MVGNTTTRKPKSDERLPRLGGAAQDGSCGHGAPAPAAVPALEAAAARNGDAGGCDPANGDVGSGDAADGDAADGDAADGDTGGASASGERSGVDAAGASGGSAGCASAGCASATGPLAAAGSSAGTRMETKTRRKTKTRRERRREEKRRKGRGERRAVTEEKRAKVNDHSGAAILPCERTLEPERIRGRLLRCCALRCAACCAMQVGHLCTHTITDSDIHKHKHTFTLSLNSMPRRFVACNQNQSAAHGPDKEPSRSPGAPIAGNAATRWRGNAPTTWRSRLSAATPAHRPARLRRLNKPGGRAAAQRRAPQYRRPRAQCRPRRHARNIRDVANVNIADSGSGRAARQCAGQPPTETATRRPALS